VQLLPSCYPAQPDEIGCPQLPFGCLILELWNGLRCCVQKDDWEDSTEQPSLKRYYVLTHTPYAPSLYEMKRVTCRSVQSLCFLLVLTADCARQWSVFDTTQLSDTHCQPLDVEQTQMPQSNRFALQNLLAVTLVSSAHWQFEPKRAGKIPVTLD